MEKEPQVPEEIFDVPDADLLEPSVDDLNEIENETASEVVEEKTQSTGETEKCKHHWVLETPIDDTSHGTCRNCDIQRDFHDRKSFGDSWSRLNYKRAQEAAERRIK